MKQLYHVTGHATFDLTECRVHRLTTDDGRIRFVVCYPIEWKTSDPQEMQPIKGPGKVMLRSFLVTKWKEVELQLTEPDEPDEPDDVISEQIQRELSSRQSSAEE